ncbi:Clp protease ClpP [Clostridium perfringens]|uniref:head maturation protease, ClpP-related n=1 Tax=Clostridium perfringens TaxID=1502 RepID=UPI0022461BD9|nr:head maturation protease, ClpP-related [Clostridium perfringens]MCX0373389.1 Clp protease ClpP [Clostridium perfringens]
MGKKFWEIKAKANNPSEADIYLYIEIASWGGGYCAHSSQSFTEELESLGDISILNVYINSPGGDVFEGYAIFNVLRRKADNCQINVYIDGMAASIASVIAMAGTHISMPSNAVMMIHRASIGIYGNSDVLAKGIKFLEKIDNNMKQTYINRSNGKLDDSTLDFLFSNGDTWLTAQECLEYGLCDEVTEEIKISAKYDSKALGNYKNIPKAFLNTQNNERRMNDEKNQKIDADVKALIDRVNNKINNWNMEENDYE